MVVKGRHSRAPSRKTSSSTLIFATLVIFSFFLLILLAFGILSLPNTSNSRKAHDLSSIVHNSVTSDGDDERGDQWVEVISWEPRAVVYHNFLSKDECEYLINLAKPHMHKSSVVDSATGKSKDSRVRTSSGTFLARGRDKTIRNIEKRIADFTFLPVEHGEGLQILHYEVGQKYEPHYDYFLDEFNTKNGGQRIATVLMYLSEVEEGGETVFPAAKGNFSAVPWWNELSECGKGGLSVKPKMGDALLFWSMKPDVDVLLSKGTNGPLQNGYVSASIRLNSLCKRFQKIESSCMRQLLYYHKRMPSEYSESTKSSDVMSFLKPIIYRLHTINNLIPPILVSCCTPILLLSIGNKV